MDVGVASKRLSVLLTALVGVLSIATGIVNIAYGDVVVIGPLQPYVSSTVRTAAGFTGALTGFLILLAAFTLRRGLRAGWAVSIVLVPVAAAQGFVQSSQLSVPLIVLSLFAIPLLVLNRRRFEQPLSLTSTQIAAGLALVSVQVYGTVGTFVLREEFRGVTTVLDAFYFTIVTASTVGYGDVHATTGIGRLFAMTVVLFGTASFAVALGSLLAPVIEARLAAALGRSDEAFELLENHVLVLGYGDLTEPIVSELQDRTQFAVVTQDPESATELADRDVTVLHADPSDETMLERVKVREAGVAIAATDDDAMDAYAILTARQLRPDLRIVAAATNAENVRKLERAGADVVASPATIGARLLVGSGTGSKRPATR